MSVCFFCDIQKGEDSQKISDGLSFYSRFDDFPISPGHAEIIFKRHVASFFDLDGTELTDMFEMIRKSKAVIDEKFHPDGYNIGLNEGKAAGQTIPHLHIHLIPRYAGDVDNPRGGVRNILHGKGDYSDEVKKMGREKYLSE